MSTEKVRPRALQHTDAVRSGKLSRGESAARVTEHSRLAPWLGRAVVAQCNIESGDAICSYSGDVLSDAECDAIDVQHSDPFCPRTCYMLAVDRGWVIDGYPEQTRCRNNIGAFINDPRNIEGAQENVVFDPKWIDERRIMVLVRATRDIKRGEELWVAYGSDWWNFDTPKAREPCCCHDN